MFLDVHKHVTSKVKNAAIEDYPYDWTVIDEFFPSNYYSELVNNKLPDDVFLSLKDFERVGSGYSDSRHIVKLKPNMPYLDSHLRLFWENFAKYITFHFSPIILDKFNIPNFNLGSDLLYVKDNDQYKLGPHTDKKTKVLTCLIYLPENDQLKKYGTSIYIPKDPAFKCIGGPHYKREFFNLYKTIEFIPNRLFCFSKSDVSFHGVEPVDENVTRNLIIFDIQKPI